jgi:hypothetical protein
MVAAITFFVYLYTTRQIMDNEGPVITMDSDSVEISVSDDGSAILDGVSALDDRDGDTSEFLLVEQLTNFLEKGRRQATIAAFDKAGNVTKEVREVVYTDYESPRFSLSAPFAFPVNSSNITKHIAAQDCLDGDISVFIKLSSEEGVTLTTEGFYEAVFTVANSAGDTARLPVTVEIYNSSERSRKPTILLNEYLVYVEKGDDFDPLDYLEEIYYGNRSYERGADGYLHYTGSSVYSHALPEILPYRDVEIENPVKTSVSGVYEVVYSYIWDESDPGTTRLIVVVTE